MMRGRKKGNVNRHLKRREDIKTLMKAFKKEKNPRAKLRIHSIILAHKSLPNSQISQILFVHPSSVKLWIERWNKEGFSGLYERERSGRPKKLRDNEIKELKRDLNSSPKDFGYLPEAWDTKTILYHIEKKFNVKFHEKSIYKFLRKIGYEMKVPRGRHYKRDEKKEKEYEEKVKGIKEKNVNFIDEKVLKIYPNLRRAWFPKNEKAQIKINWVPREKIVIYGALDRFGGFIWKIYDKMKWENTKEFVKKIRGVIIGDGASWHKGLFSRKNFIRLPPYCPERNPLEEVWRILNMRIKNVFIQSKEELNEIVTSILKDMRFNISFDKFL